MNIEPMDLLDYQEKAAEFAVYPDNVAIVYPLLGLFGEVGELANKYQKVMRGDKMLEVFEQEALPELGDVLWFFTALATDLGFSICAIEPTVHTTHNVDEVAETVNIERLNLADTLFKLGYLSGVLLTLQYEERLENFIGLMRDLLQTICDLANVLGSSLEAVAAANIAKLTDRKNRKVIGGDGDNR